VNARNAAVWPFITVRDSLFSARVCATHSGLYTLAGRPVTQIVFTYLAYIYCCTALIYIDIQHYCTVADAFFSNVFFFRPPPPPHTHTRTPLGPRIVSLFQSKIFGVHVCRILYRTIRFRRILYCFSCSCFVKSVCSNILNIRSVCSPSHYIHLFYITSDIFSFYRFARAKREHKRENIVMFLRITFYVNRSRVFRNIIMCTSLKVHL